MDGEVAKLDPVLDPIEAHVHGLGSSDFGTAVGEAVSSRVICGDSSGLGLVSAQLCENVSDVGPLFAIMEDGPDFCLRSRRHDISHDSTFHMYRAIGSWKISWFLVVA
jgi:hypothetical protein